MSTEIRNWDVVAKAMEAAGATSSQMYIRAKALAEGNSIPCPQAFLRLLTASLLWLADYSKKSLTDVRLYLLNQ